MSNKFNINPKRSLNNEKVVVFHKVVPPTGIAESHTPCSIAAGSHINKGNISCRVGSSVRASGKPVNSSMLKPKTINVDAMAYYIELIPRIPYYETALYRPINLLNAQLIASVGQIQGGNEG